MYSEEAPLSIAPTIAGLPHQYEDVGSRVNVDQHATSCSQVVTAVRHFNLRGVFMSGTQLKCKEMRWLICSNL